MEQLSVCALPEHKTLAVAYGEKKHALDFQKEPCQKEFSSVCISEHDCAVCDVHGVRPTDKEGLY